jgi:hypothetical protein
MADNQSQWWQEEEEGTRDRDVVCLVLSEMVLAFFGELPDFMLTTTTTCSSGEITDPMLQYFLYVPVIQYSFKICCFAAIYKHRYSTVCVYYSCFCWC